MRSEPRTSDDSWLPITVQVPGPEPIVLNYTPCPNQYLTFPLLLKFCHSFIYNLTLLPYFPSYDLGHYSGLETDFYSFPE